MMTGRPYSFKKRVLVLVLSVLTLGLTVHANAPGDPIRRLIRKTDNQLLEQKLKTFRKGGTGKYLDTGDRLKGRFVRLAKRYEGTPYCWGGASKKCIDCSGLVYVSLQKMKIDIPRSAEDQARYGRIILKKKRLRRGDLVFFTNTYQTNSLVTHVGICIGRGKFVHAASSGVVIGDLDDPYYWNDKFLFGSRIFR